MALMKPTESWAVTAEEAATRRGYASRSELRLRNAVEDFLRQRYPDARLCHEMVMGERQVRADVVAVAPSHIAAVEVKGESDSTVRLLHQVGMYQLCVPEVWILTTVARGHNEDALLIRHLMPSVGVMTGTGLDRYGPDVPCVLDVVAEPNPRPPHPEMMLEMLWAQELANVMNRARIAQIKSKLPTRRHMITTLLARLSAADLLSECCAELRGRDALWRADPPVKIAS